MTNALNPQKVALTLGGLFSFLHVVWSVFVGFGWAGPLMSWVLGLHMVQASVTVLPFSLMTALGLVIMAGIVGSIVGYLFALLWNSANKL